MTIEIIPLVLPPPITDGSWPQRIDHKIVKAAVKMGDKVYIGWRHSHILGYLREQGFERLSFGAQEDQGFIDQLGWFLSRELAAKIAYGSRQCTQVKCGMLLSENVWDEDGTPRPDKPFDPMGDSKTRVRQ